MQWSFIIEDFIEKEGAVSFVVDSKLLYNGSYDQCFDNEAESG